MVCPFFMSSGGLAINCESPVPGAIRNQTLYANRREFRLQFYTYCSTQTCKYCEIYRAVMEAKYHDSKE